MYTRNWDDFCLVNLIYFTLHIFQIRKLLHCVDESWWNMPFKETPLGDGVADDAVAMLLPLWLHAAALWRHEVWILLWRHTMHEWVMNIHYKTWIAQGRFTNMILTPRNNGACVIINLSHLTQLSNINQSCLCDMRLTYIWSRELWWGCVIKCRNPGIFRNNIMLKAVWGRMTTMSSRINVYTFHLICCGEAERLFRRMIGFMISVASVASYVIQQHER